MPEIVDRAQDFIKRVSTLEIQHNDLVRLLANAETKTQKARQDHADALTHSTDLGEAIEGAKQIIEILSEQGLQGLKSIVTDGLQAIFEGCNYSFDIEISDRGKDKTADLILVEAMPDGSTKRTLLSDNGWGIQSMVSLILRVFFICHLGIRRFLILDESMVQLSKEYVDGLFTFLRSLTNDLGFDILCITHDPRFVPYGDRVYEMAQGELRPTKETS